MTEAWGPDDDDGRAGPRGPVRVRVPAKINLHLGVGPLRAGRLPRAQHRLPRDRHLRRADRPPRRHPHPHHGGRGRRRRWPSTTPTWSSAPPAPWPPMPGCPRTPGCTCASRSRSPVAWPGAAPTRPPPWSPATRSGAPACPGTSSPRSAPTSAPTCRSCMHGGTALGTGHGEAVSPILARPTTWHWVVAIADGGLSTPDVYRELDRLRGSPLAAHPAGHRRRAHVARCANATPRSSAPPSPTTCSRPRCRCGPALADVLKAGYDAGAVAGTRLRFRPDLRLPRRRRRARRRRRRRAGTPPGCAGRPAPPVGPSRAPG